MSSVRESVAASLMEDEAAALREEIEELRAELREAHGELSRVGCQPGQRLSQRIREAHFITRQSFDEAVAVAEKKPYRRKLPRERPSLTHKVVIGGHDVYIIAGFFEDGQPGEIFFRVAKEGSTLYGLLDCYAIAISLALQWGAPFESLADKFVGQSFEPCGVTSNSDIETAASIIDYVFRWLKMKVYHRMRRLRA